MAAHVAYIAVITVANRAKQFEIYRLTVHVLCRVSSKDKLQNPVWPGLLGGRAYFPHTILHSQVVSTVSVARDPMMMLLDRKCRKLNGTSLLRCPLSSHEHVTKHISGRWRKDGQPTKK